MMWWYHYHVCCSTADTHKQQDSLVATSTGARSLTKIISVCDNEPGREPNIPTFPIQSCRFGTSCQLFFISLLQKPKRIYSFRSRTRELKGAIFSSFFPSKLQPQSLLSRHRRESAFAKQGWFLPSILLYQELNFPNPLLLAVRKCRLCASCSGFYVDASPPVFLDTPPAHRAPSTSTALHHACRWDPRCSASASTLPPSHRRELEEEAAASGSTDLRRRAVASTSARSPQASTGRPGVMEWDKAKASSAAAAESADERTGGEGLGYVKVMTDEQMEVLRKQISIYATICEQLVEMHRALTAHQDTIAGMRLGNLYCDPLMVTGGHKVTARQRWTPTQMQLQILENIFDQGNGTPSKQKIKDITAELSQHGQISETNVYNWFQNRRARSKRKQAASLPNNAESEAEADEESPTDKKPKSDRSLHQNMAVRDHNSERISEMHHFDTEHEQIRGMMYGPNDSSSRSSGSLGQMSLYETIMPNPRFDHFLGKMESPGSFSHLRPGESFDMFG